MSDMNIYQRINAVMREVEYVQKDAVVQGYKAVTHDMVTAVVRPSFVKNGIVVRPEQLTSSLIQQRGTNPKSDKEYTMHLYSGDYAIHFVNADNPEDFLTVTVNAHANDNGDKAPGKAMSYAVKYAVLKLLSLETGENEEARFTEPYSQEQLEVYHDLINTDKAYELYMFVATLPVETVTALVNSFPDGHKAKGKKKAAELEAAGHEVFVNVVAEVQKRLASHDISVIEITDEMSGIEKSLLAKRLTDFEIAQLRKIKEAAA